MSEERPFTISSFYKFVGENRLMAAKCSECGNVLLPPKPICTKCLSTNLKWIELEGAGKLLSYTIIHVAPEQFQSMTPYNVGIVEFKSGLRLPGMINNVTPEKLKVGMELKICFNTSTSAQWPAWSRYFFRPV
ncbi:Zn-ribbon domain-containing OB-fold protein [Candidatus Bathyarchaeota archaeon]|nr:Zn-ribbon domain-containing OB-fold protein [Candidatus Bathyarchaeota archaeon]